MSPSLTDTADQARERHTQLVARLRTATDFIETHPDLDVYAVQNIGSRVLISDYSPQSAEDLARLTRSLGGRWEKEDAGDLFKLRREIADGVTVELVTWREQVCERVVVSTNEVEIEEPDPDAVAALPTVKRTETVETVEWRCRPILPEAGS